MKRTVVVCLLAAALATMSGCIAIGGSETSARPTTGQELIDLKAALDKGAINQAEYDTKKADILRRK
ncbi:MAG: SHOCT domain-containing protein [Phycisphaerae bacterium]